LYQVGCFSIDSILVVENSEAKKQSCKCEIRTLAAAFLRSIELIEIDLFFLF